MLSNEMLRHFLLGFISVFRFGAIPIKETSFLDSAEYFDKVEKDINKSYEELKAYEGN